MLSSAESFSLYEREFARLLARVLAVAISSSVFCRCRQLALWFMGGNATGRYAICPACRQSVSRVRNSELQPHTIDGEACSTKLGECRECKGLHRIRVNGLIVKHTRPGGDECGGSRRKPRQADAPEQNNKHRKNGTVDCPVCRQTVKRTDNGTVSPHNSHRSGGLMSWCNGSGAKVAAPPPNDDERPDDRDKSLSIRTINAGLGSLGKRRR